VRILMITKGRRRSTEMAAATAAGPRA